MSRICLFFSLFLLSGMMSAQVNEDFSDGNFTANPPWSGDVADFTVNSSNQLQLNSSGAGDSYLVTPNSLAGSTQWEFWIKLAFAPSGNNYGRVYLLSDEKAIKDSALNGYYLQFGEPGADDAIELVRQDGLSTTVVCRGTDGLVAGSFEMRMRVIRDTAGNWTLLADPAGGYNFQPQAAGHDDTYSGTSWFGVYYDYTMSNATKFYFDDIHIQHHTPNVTPPTLESITVLNENELLLEYSEIVTTETAENPDNYSVSPAVGNPASAIQYATDARKVTLSFAMPFTSALPYQLHIQGVEDLAGNSMTAADTFLFYEAQRGDIVINEIMANPNPPVGLPDAPYIELLNTAPYPVSIHDWPLQTGPYTKMLSGINIKPDSFLILCHEDHAGLLKPYGPVYELPSLVLANTGATLVLKNYKGQLINHVAYKDTWYQDDQKNDGGWALEQIDPENACAGLNNWAASKALHGGTPGTPNSVKAPNPNTKAPYINSVVVLDSVSLRVKFSEAMDTISIKDAASYFIDNGIGKPVEASAQAPEYHSVVLQLPDVIQPGLVYQLRVVDTVKDCAGNAAAVLTYPFALYDPKFQDVIINEIMCKPSDDKGLPDVVYLEIKNVSPFPVNTANWKLSYHSYYGSKSLSGQTILPDSLAIICHEKDLPEMQDYGPVSTVSSLILPNSGSELVLMDSLNRLISYVHYSEDWYKDAHKSNSGGWSLEMIDTDYPCTGYENWRASMAVEGGTPGRPNSAAQKNPDTRGPEYISTIYVNPSVFIIELDEMIAPDALPPASAFEVNGMGPAVGVQLVEPACNRIQLILSSPLQGDSVYQLVINDSITDCAGNLMERTVLPLAVPGIPEPGDIVINELLFEPPDAAEDYVEIINNSGKPLYLYRLNLVFTDPRDLSNVSEVALDDENRVLFNREIRCFTRERRKLSKAYKRAVPNNIFQKNDMPQLLSDSGIVSLENSYDGKRLDSVCYAGDMHSPLLKTTKGVSLERISPALPSTDRDNWLSAAETAGFGTPGFINSQYNRPGVARIGEVNLEYILFSPDGDGDHDVLIINYSMEKPGFLGNVRIYDRNGREIRQLKNNVLMEKEGSFIWDGAMDNGGKAPIGIYMVYVEVFDPEGKREKFKLPAVLGGRLN